MAGKWHVGEKQPHWPKDRGFDRYFGLVSGSSSYFRVTEERPLVDEDKTFRPKDDSFYLTDLFTDHASGSWTRMAAGPSPSSSIRPSPARTGPCTPGPRTSRATAASTRLGGMSCASAATHA